jgi:hypothetical protein
VLGAALVLWGTCAPLPLLAAVELAAGARSEARVGSAPPASGQPSEPAFALELTQLAGIRIGTRRDTLTLRYTPRFFFRYPNALELTRPLFLHAADARHEHRLSRRGAWENWLVASAGEVDYGSAELALSSRQATAVNVAVIQFVSLDGGSSVSHAFDRRSSATLGVFAGYRAPYEELGSGSSESAPFPSQRHVGVDAKYAHRARSTTELSVPTRIRADAFSSGEQFVATTARLVWRERLERGVSSELSGGATHVRRLDTADSDDDVVPQARAELVARLSSSARTRVEQRSAVFVEAFLDPVRATYVPAFGVEEALHVELLPRWRVGLELRLSTPLAADDARAAEIDSVMTASTPIVYRLGPAARLELGSRLGARDTDLGDLPFSARELELWGYVAFAFAFGSGDPRFLL